MDANEYDTKMFYKLVKKQRARLSTATESLQCDGNILSGAEEIASGFAAHFKDLATPTPNDSFDESYYRQLQ